MSYENLTLPYWVTKDYVRLLGLLADRNEIVCFVDYRFRPDDDSPPSRDVCSARCFADDDYIRISARGIQYNDPLTHVNDSVKFIADCKRMNLEFVDPDPDVTRDATVETIHDLAISRNELLSVVKEALAQTSCDGDLCAYQWHERARTAIAEAEGV